MKYCEPHKKGIMDLQVQREPQLRNLILVLQLKSKCTRLLYDWLLCFTLKVICVVLSSLQDIITNIKARRFAIYVGSDANISILCTSFSAKSTMVYAVSATVFLGPVCRFVLIQVPDRLLKCFRLTALLWCLS